MVMLENMRDDIKLIAEGQMGIYEKLDEINGRLDENKSDHEAIMEYLSRLEDEMMDIKERLENIEKNKANRSDYDFLKRKVEVLERQMEKFKVLLKVRKA